MPSRRTLRSLLRRLAAVPAVLYELGLGRLLAHRFLMVVHRGRLRRTVLEVIAWDGRAREAVVIADLGPDPDPHSDLLAGGAEEVRIGAQRFRPWVRRLKGEEAFAVFSEFERRNRLLMPLARPVVSRLAGLPYDGSPAARRRLLERMPLLALSDRRA
ncbi:MAG: nitroreductase family deazaflavin-dependent oxidoreductase [Solirubrobacterales bacterium]